MFKMSRAEEEVRQGSAALQELYVRSLEEKVRQMEAQENGLSSTIGQSPAQQSNRLGDVTVVQSTGSNPWADVTSDGGGNRQQQNAGAQLDSFDMWQHPTLPQQSPSFAQELKTLSLEAAAERHLGPTSGLYFAKLTQTVLKRLTPDKADLVFAPYQENAPGASFFNFNSPSEVFNQDMYEHLSGSISVHPLLFGDLFLADLTGSGGNEVEDIQWPSDEAHVQHLVDIYFAHSHTLYPILVKSEIMQALEGLRGAPQNLAVQTPLQNFRLWMVLAIGSTAYSSVSLTEESESRVYYNKALQYADQALECDEMSALEVIMLQVSYSFFNQLGPNTWFLVGTAARLALGIGLHTSSTYDNVPFSVQQRWKRVFFSVYMMDRVVSMALGRPFAIHDDDVDITPFEDIDEDSDEPADARRQSLLQPTLLAVPLHILKLRQIASKISRQVYTTKKSSDSTAKEPQEVLTSLHQELLEWRRGMPFPLPDTNPIVPHLNTLWYDFNYYTHLAMIYRPSPLVKSPDVEGTKIVETAASMSLRQAFGMHQQKRLAYNWLNFLSIFTSTLSLVYAITVQSDGLPVAVKQRRAIDDLELAVQLFDAFGLKFAAAGSIRHMITEIVRRYREVCAAAA
ncbi:uncharacterized protein E0L32_008916 [Thyridium curvatum]|uniref:Xylanolytic transcriptional activator regulatory domain-containing protein n=1 Tax=Thyridium curvatum TaxID=1093900 RepID=A0A507ATS2_9PEZI|nr:uncharacterized protein E0L32_008916 [Thyridium curvatum]TPX09894.1 hypothetical protein E0L32_008916 [Thyridium curvatum]